jgi:hypothetical protein
MIALPPHLINQYRTFCTRNGVSERVFADYVKWIRYFLDFCEKYQVAGEEGARTARFLAKLQQKGQSEDKRQQAANAVASTSL